ncbi:MAG: gamma-glutamyltransferase [Cyanothece sp. SIO1E1]|nr:gamma-glutamyltransferase [Cyanothece sp. SIO1E1]
MGGAIAAGHEKTAAVGAEILQLGGNAFDAAVGAMLASFITESTLTSAAGGGFLLAHTQTGQNILFDFFTQTPQQKLNQPSLDFYPIGVNFGDTVQEFHIGLGSIATPGNVGGLFYVHQKLGRLPLKVVAEPAIHLAKTGIQIDAFQAYCMYLLQPILTTSEAARQIYAPNGTSLTAGDTLLMRDFANTLTDLVAMGPREFYAGAIAHQLVQDCQTQGGYLALADLSQYHVIERAPLTIQYRDTTLLTNPPPSSGGTLIAFALKLLSQVDLSSCHCGSTQHLQTLAEVMRLTNQARRDRYDANIYRANVADQFLSPHHLAGYQQQLATAVNKWGSTTHISVVDGEGNAASVTTSNGEGSSYLIPGTGIMMNNMLGEADLNPHGFHQWQANQRISSMMAPTIVLKNHRPEIVLGSGGSNRIRTAILQVISNMIDFHMPADEAVNYPRMHWEGNALHLEPGFAPNGIETIDAHLKDSLTLWTQQNMFFGGVHVVRVGEDGHITGAGDPRRHGAIAIVTDLVTD